MRLLFTVTDAFTIQGHGVVLLPELRFTGDERIAVGDPLLLKRPDGTDAPAVIDAIELLKPVQGKCQSVIMLRGKNKNDVLIGTEVWLM
jgi:hypothetical protein